MKLKQAIIRTLHEKPNFMTFQGIIEPIQYNSLQSILRGTRSKRHIPFKVADDRTIRPKKENEKRTF